MLKRVSVVLCVAASLPLFCQGKFDKRLNESADVLRTIVTKQNLSKEVLDKAVCIAVYPSVKKVGVGLGVTYGRGVLSCRGGSAMDGDWSAPAMYTLDTGSLGVQLGSTATDYVLVVVSKRGAEKLLSGKLKLGADASAVAGPSGAKAVGANDPNTDILAYSQAKGLFAGASLGSASLATDDDANKGLYGKPITATQIIREGVPVPAAGKAWVDALNSASPKYTP